MPRVTLRQTKRRSQQDEFAVLLTFLPWISGMAHRLLEFSLPTYRKVNARALEKKSGLGRVLQILDLLASINFGLSASTTGMGKDFTGVHFKPGLRVSNTYSRLHKADLREANLSDAIFDQVNLRKTIWCDTWLSNCIFNSCNFDHAHIYPSSTRGTSFVDCDLRRSMVGGNFEGCTFDRAALDRCRLTGAKLRTTRFLRCSLKETDFARLDLQDAVFEECDLQGANFTSANLQQATFRRCNMQMAIWSDADIAETVIVESEIYGMALWGTRGEIDEARALTLTKPGQATVIEVDALHIAVFIASLMDGNGIRELVDGPSSTLVLILGRFSVEHKRVLDELRSHLRELGYTAIVFDSSTPRYRDTTETVSILAKLSRFVIADLTEPKSVPHELQQFVTSVRTPLQVVTRGEQPFSMFSDLEKYPWVLSPRQFNSCLDLLGALPELVDILEQRREELLPAHTPRDIPVDNERRLRRASPRRSREHS